MIRRFIEMVTISQKRTFYFRIRQMKIFESNQLSTEYSGCSAHISKINKIRRFVEMDTISQRRTFHIRIANVNFRINGYYALISFVKIAKGFQKLQKKKNTFKVLMSQKSYSQAFDKHLASNF